VGKHDLTFCVGFFKSCLIQMIVSYHFLFAWLFTSLLYNNFIQRIFTDVKMSSWSEWKVLYDSTTSYFIWSYLKRGVWIRVYICIYNIYTYLGWIKSLENKLKDDVLQQVQADTAFYRYIRCIYLHKFPLGIPSLFFTTELCCTGLILTAWAFSSLFYATTKKLQNSDVLSPYNFQV